MEREGGESRKGRKRGRNGGTCRYIGNDGNMDVYRKEKDH